MSRPASPEIEESVARAVALALPGATASATAMVEGGHSGITVRTTISGPDGAVDAVLKMSPQGKQAVGRHDVLRQAAIVEALSEVPGVRVPRVLFTSAGDPQVFAMELVAGDAAEPVLDDPGLTPEEVAARARSAAQMLAALHQAPLSLAVLAAEEPAGLAAELERWTRLMDAVPLELRPRAGDLHSLLEGSEPAPTEPGFVHGDYRIGNVLCAEGEVLAVIDFEIWSVGDRRVDLGWFRLFCDDSNFPEASSAAGGLPDADELLDIYERAGGVRGEDIEWFDAFAAYKMAAIMGHNLRRHREGRHHDPYQETLLPTILGLVDHGIEVLEGARSRTAPRA